MANAKHIDIDGTVLDIIPSGNYVTGVKGNSESTYRSGNVNITKTNVGLGNVPNVSTNNQAPTFTQATTRANIASGETLTVILGKIMKFFTDLKTVAFTGAYSDLSGLPTIPTVNNATLTIQKNGTDVQTFTANASSNKTANITVPTKTSELTNDSGFITNAGVTGVKGNSETAYRTGNVNITKANIGLGSVPNVTTNNQAPTFTQATTRANIASGETLTVILGKVMKFFADLKTVAFTGAYSDLSGLPTIPTVNNATLTIQRNGTNVQTFTANASSNKTANISCNTISNLLEASKTGITVNANNSASVTLAHTAGSVNDLLIQAIALTGAFQVHVVATSWDASNIYLTLGNCSATNVTNLQVKVLYRKRT